MFDPLIRCRRLTLRPALGPSPPFGWRDVHLARGVGFVLWRRLSIRFGAIREHALLGARSNRLDMPAFGDAKLDPGRCCPSRMLNGRVGRRPDRRSSSPSTEPFRVGSDRPCGPTPVPFGAPSMLLQARAKTLAVNLRVAGVSPVPSAASRCAKIA